MAWRNSALPKKWFANVAFNPSPRNFLVRDECLMNAQEKDLKHQHKPTVTLTGVVEQLIEPVGSTA